MTDKSPSMNAISRRSFVAKSALAGVAAACGTDLIRSSNTAQAASASPAAAAKVSFTQNDVPAASDKPDLLAYNNVVAAFEKLHPNITVVGKNDAFDPTTFYAHYAVGNVEDTYSVYFTDVQHLIQLGYCEEVTSWVKSWQWFSSINPSIVKTMSDASGKIYGIPTKSYALGLCYRKDYFTTAGLDPKSPPTTWDEFRMYAKTLAKVGVGRYGFAPLSIQNTGGWHLCAMMFSYGGQPEIFTNGKPVANLTSPNCVKPLQLLYDMRWVDKSIGPKELGYDQNTAALASGTIAMGILAGDQISHFKADFQAPLGNFILAGLPQGGGNATLTGGNVQLVKPKSSGAVTDAALEFAAYRYWDPSNRVATDKAAVSTGQAVGIPSDVTMTGLLKKQFDSIDAKYSNVPVQNYALFTAACAKQFLTPEVRIASQQMYALLDVCVQSVLTDESSKPADLLATANTKFQALLDASQS